MKGIKRIQLKKVLNAITWLELTPYTDIAKIGVDIVKEGGAIGGTLIDLEAIKSLRDFLDDFIDFTEPDEEDQWKAYRMPPYFPGSTHSNRPYPVVTDQENTES